MTKEMMIIKQGKFELKVPRSELVQIDETHDGITFLFKDGIQLYKTDQFMTQAVKSIMKNTADSFPGKKLIFELDNRRNPVVVDAT